MEKKVKKGFISMIGDSILKPISSVESNAATLKNPKDTFIFAGIIAVAITVCKLITTMLSTIFYKQYDFWTQKYSWNISFSNLDSLDYVNLIFVNLLQYAIVILGIAGVYYLATLVLKKDTTYVKTLGIVSVAVIPNIVLSFAGSILGIIWSPIATFIGAAAVAYTILILTLSLKNILKINDFDKLIFFNVIIVAILKVLEYIVFSSKLFS